MIFVFLFLAFQLYLAPAATILLAVLAGYRSNRRRPGLRSIAPAVSGVAIGVLGGALALNTANAQKLMEREGKPAVLMNRTDLAQSLTVSATLSFGAAFTCMAILLMRRIQRH